MTVWAYNLRMQIAGEWKISPSLIHIHTHIISSMVLNWILFGG